MTTPTTSSSMNTRKLPVRASRNACKLCTPLGACLVFAGIESTRTILHGSQGCATYIRRYMISHFKEPIDIASSSFGEASAIYGGRENLRLGLENVARQYQPKLIGVATTCLAETIGDDVGMFLREIAAESTVATHEQPMIVHVSTPSYSGTHADGYDAAVRAVVEQLATAGAATKRMNVFPGMFSAADLRYLQEILQDFHQPATILPDYAETLDGPLWDEYQLIPPGGTPLAEVCATGRAAASIEFSFTNHPGNTAAAWLNQQFGIPRYRLGCPIGVRQTDELFKVLTALTDRPIPEKHRLERGRLLDALVDAHKYVFGKRAAIFGEEDLVAGVASLLTEIGVLPALCVSGGKSGRLRQAISELAPELAQQIEVHQGVDFAEFDELIGNRNIDLLIGNSKGHAVARRLQIPLIRVGFPIHDRIGGARLMHIGYRGAQSLFDRITNALIDVAQSNSTVGYSYM